MAQVHRDARTEGLDDAGLAPAELAALADIFEMARASKAFAAQLARQVVRIAQDDRRFRSHLKAAMKAPRGGARSTSAAEHLNLLADWLEAREGMSAAAAKAYLAAAYCTSEDNIKNRLTAARKALPNVRMRLVVTRKPAP